MAEVEAWVNYISPVAGTKEAVIEIDEDLASNQLIFPSPETLSKAKQFRDLSAEEESEYSRLFTNLTTG
jgi:spermidine/putrescine transport system substrate-binding protein